MKKLTYFMSALLIGVVILSSCDILDELLSGNGDDDKIEDNTFTDPRDGRVYKTVEIGDQIWMAENLNATKYNDGTQIPHVIGNSEWKNSSTGAYCYYDNDSDIDDKYGVIYNWLAVETNKLCPKGWHVPTDEEWTQLENYLAANGYNFDGTTSDDSEKIAKALSSEEGWHKSVGKGAVGNTDYPEYRNKSGFSALPGGLRYHTNTFSSFQIEGAWWTATEQINAYTPDYALHRSIHYTNSAILSNVDNKLVGMSVRCVKD